MQNLIPHLKQQVIKLLEHIRSAKNCEESANICHFFQNRLLITQFQTGISGKLGTLHMLQL